MQCNRSFQVIDFDLVEPVVWPRRLVRFGVAASGSASGPASARSDHARAARRNASASPPAISQSAANETCCTAQRLQTRLRTAAALSLRSASHGQTRSSATTPRAPHSAHARAGRASGLARHSAASRWPAEYGVLTASAEPIGAGIGLNAYVCARRRARGAGAAAAGSLECESEADGERALACAGASSESSELDADCECECDADIALASHKRNADAEHAQSQNDSKSERMGAWQLAMDGRKLIALFCAGNLISSVLRSIWGEDEVRILILGLDGAGCVCARCCAAVFRP